MYVDPINPNSPSSAPLVLIENSPKKNEIINQASKTAKVAKPGLWGWFVKGGVKALTKIAVGTVDGTTEEELKTRTESLRIIAPHQGEGLKNMAKSLATKLGPVIGEGGYLGESSVALIEKTLEVNILIIFQRYITKIKSKEDSLNFDALSAEDLILQIVNLIAQDMHEFPEKLKSLESKLAIDLKVNQENINLPPEIRAANETKILKEFEKQKNGLIDLSGDMLLKVLFPNQQDSIVIPTKSWAPALGKLYWILAKMVTNLAQTMTSQIRKMNEDYRANVKVVQNFDQVHGGSVIELSKALTSRFDALLQFLFSSEEKAPLIENDENVDPLKPLLPKFKNLLSQKLGEEVDTSGATQAVNFVGGYGNQILMHILANACKDATGNKHIVTTILENILSKALAFDEESNEQLKAAFDEYEKTLIQVQNNYSPDDPQLDIEIKKVKDQIKAKFDKLVDSILHEFGVDLEGLKKILPHEFEGTLNWLQSLVGKDTMSPAVNAARALKKFVTDFIFQFYRDVIIPQGQQPNYKDSILRYDETLKNIDQLIDATLPIVNVSLTDPQSELGKILLAAVNDLLLDKFQANADFFADPIRQIMQSELMPNIENFLKTYSRNILMGLLAHLALHNPLRQNDEKVDLLGDSIPYLLKICSDHIEAETLIPQLSKWKVEFENCQKWPEKNDVEKMAKKAALNNLHVKRVELVNEFKLAATAILNEAGWDKDNMANIPVPQMLKDKVKDIFSGIILPDLLFRIYTDTFVLDDIKEAKATLVSSQLMTEAMPSIKSSLEDYSYLFAFKINKLLTLSEMSSQQEALLGHDLNQIYTSKNEVMKPVWKRLERFISQLMAQTIQRLSSCYKGEASNADDLTKAFLQLKNSIQNHKLNSTIEKDILTYKEKTRVIKELDDHIASLKKEAVKLAPHLSDEHRKLLPDLQIRLKQEGKTLKQIEKEKKDFIKNLHFSDEMETLSLTKKTCLEAIEGIDQALIELNVFLDKRIDDLSGQVTLKQYQLASYAALLNEIEELVSERSERFFLLHKVLAGPHQAMESGRLKYKKSLETLKEFLKVETLDRKQGIFIALEVYLNNQQDRLEHYLHQPHLPAAMAENFEAELRENKQILARFKFLPEKINDSEVEQVLDLIKKSLNIQQNRSQELLQSDISPELKNKIQAELIENKKNIERLQYFPEFSEREIRGYLNSIYDDLMQKRERLLKVQEQPNFVNTLESMDNILQNLTSMAARGHNAENTARLSQEVKKYLEEIDQEEKEGKKEIGLLQEWVNLRTKIAQNPPPGFDPKDTLKIHQKIQLLEKKLFRLNRRALQDPLFKLKDTDIEALSPEQTTQIWNDLIQAHKNRQRQTKQEFEQTPPLKVEFEEIIDQFIPLAKSLLGQMGFGEPQKLPVPFFFQKIVWMQLVNSIIPLTMMDFYAAAWIGAPEVRDAEVRALQGSQIENSLLASHQMAEIATGQIKAAVKKEPKKTAEKLAEILQDLGLSGLDAAWLENLFSMITTDERLWSNIKKFVDNRFEYVITHLSGGNKGSEFLPSAIKSFLSSFKTHIKDRRKDIDALMGQYEQIKGNEEKESFRQRISSELFTGFVDGLLAQTGLNKPNSEAFGIAHAGTPILKALRNKLLLLCFDYCRDMSKNTEELSKLPEELEAQINEGNPNLTEAQVTGIRDIYESLFGFIGDQINHVVITAIKGGMVPESSDKDKPIDLSSPFNTRWKEHKIGDWVPKVTNEVITLVLKETPQPVDSNEKIEIAGAKQITPLMIYTAISKRNNEKLAKKMLGKIAEKAKELNIPLTKEFYDWLDHSLQIILGDEEVMKLLSDIPEWVKGILLKKCVQLTKEPVQINGENKILKVNEIPSYFFNSFFNTFKKHGSVMKNRLHAILTSQSYHYKNSSITDEDLLKLLEDDIEFTTAKKEMVAELLNLVKFDPKKDLPPLPMLKNLWESSGLSFLEKLLAKNYLNIAKIEIGSNQQKDELEKIFPQGISGDQTLNDLQKVTKNFGNTVLSFIGKLTGIIPTEVNNTSLFAHEQAKSLVATLVKTLKLKESSGNNVFRIWLAEFFKETLDSTEVKEILSQLPLIMENVIYKKIIQLADLSPESKMQGTGQYLLADVALVILDQLADSRTQLAEAFEEAIQKNPQSTDEELIKKLHNTSEAIVKTLFDKLKLNPKEDLQVLFAEEIWEKFGKAALADYISSIYLKTIKFYDKDNKKQLAYLLYPRKLKEFQLIERLNVSKLTQSQSIHVPLEPSQSLNSSTGWGQSVSLEASQVNKTPQPEEVTQINNVLGAFGDMIRDKVKTQLNLIPEDSQNTPRDFAVNTLNQVLEMMGVHPSELSPTLRQWGEKSLEKMVTSPQVNDLLNEIPEKVKEIVLNKLIQLGQKTNLPIQPENGDSRLKCLPANIVIILLNTLHAQRQKLRPIAKETAARQTELQRTFEKKKAEIKANWKTQKEYLRKTLSDKKTISLKITEGKKKKNEQIAQIESELNIQLKANAATLKLKLKPICLTIVENLFKKNALNIDISKDIPLPYADKLWDKFGKDAFADKLASAYVEMSQSNCEVEIHKRHLAKRYPQIKKGNEKTIVEAAHVYADFVQKKIKNIMIIDTPGLDAGIEAIIKQFYGSGEQGKEVAYYLEKNKKAVQDWFVKNNLTKIAQSNVKGVEEGLFSVIGEDVEAVMLKIFDDFTGNIKDMEEKDPSFTYKLSMNMIKIFTDHLKAVNAVTQEAGKEYMYQVNPVVMQKNLGDKKRLHPDMPDYKLLIGINTLKQQIQAKEKQLQKLKENSISNKDLIEKIEIALNSDKSNLEVLKNEAASKLKNLETGTYSKLIKFVLDMANFKEAKDLPGPSLGVKQKLWDLLNGDLGIEMVKMVCEQYLTPDSLNTYMLSLMQTINKKITEWTPVENKTAPKVLTAEQKQNQQQCLDMLKSLAGAFPNTLEASLINLATRFDITSQSLESIIRQSLEEMPISKIIEQALISGGNILSQVKLPETAEGVNAHKKVLKNQFNEAPEKIRNEAVAIVKNVLILIWRMIKHKWDMWQKSIDKWIVEHLGGEKGVAIHIKAELDFIFRTIFFTCIGTVVKWLLNIPYQLFLKYYLEAANRRDAEINRRVWTDTSINANLALFEVNALMDNLKIHRKPVRKAQPKRKAKRSTERLKTVAQ